MTKAWTVDGAVWRFCALANPSRPSALLSGATDQAVRSGGESVPFEQAQKTRMLADGVEVGVGVHVDKVVIAELK
jgi:hypothetical protein